MLLLHMMAVAFDDGDDLLAADLLRIVGDLQVLSTGSNVFHSAQIPDGLYDRLYFIFGDRGRELKGLRLESGRHSSGNAGTGSG